MALRKKMKLKTSYNKNSALEDSYSRWQQRIAIKKRPPTEEGRELIDMAISCESTEFATYLKNKLGIQNATADFGYSMLEEELTYQQFELAPYEVASNQYELWKEISPKNARTSLFWTVAHIAMLENAIFKPTSLLSSKNVGKCDHTVTGCIHHRDIFRRMGGLHHIRGYFTAFVDCPTAAAWWKIKLINEAKEYHPGLRERDAYDAMKKNVWTEFVAYIMNRIAVLSVPQMRASLIMYMAKNSGQIKNDQAISALAREVARLGVGFQFSILSAETCYELVEKAGEKISAE